MKKIVVAFISASLLFFTIGWRQTPTPANHYSNPEVTAFLEEYNSIFQELLIASNEAEWTLNTRIVEGDNSAKDAVKEANAAFAAFTGSNKNIDSARGFLKERNNLSPIEIRQLELILYTAGANPESAKDIVQRKIDMEAEQTSRLFGFDYRIKEASVTTNQIDGILKSNNNTDERLRAWEASKEVGINLKEGVVELRDLRNATVKELGYPDYFAYQVSDYGMKGDEMVTLCNSLVNDVWPLYRELHTWARYTLAKKYGAKVPEYLPAHWLPNRWGQDWTALINAEGMNVDGFLKDQGAEYIVKQGEEFYVSMGFQKLPDTFYEKSSLYPLNGEDGVKKNNHASAWHMDYDKDVRSLMSVEPNTEWWGTVLHELGHIYYYTTYSIPDVPIILRNGANRGYHEAMGSLIGLAALQQDFLEGRGMLGADAKTDKTQMLLREALDFIVHIPWGAGVMTNYENELYSKNLPSSEMNKKWWELVKKYQGIVPPSPRGEKYCDAATKTHIVNDPAQYYDYSISNVLLFMFHLHISEQILKQDPHNTNYWGSKETGEFLRSLMVTGATEDWRVHLQKHLGQQMSAKAMVDYFSPLMKYLKEQNKGRKHTLPEKIS